MLDWWPFGTTRTIRCPDGRIAIIYRNINDALPLELRDRNGKASVNGSAIGAGNANVSGEFASTVNQILFAIDGLNNSQTLDFRSAYLTYMTDPCGKSEFLERALHKMIDDRNFLQKLHLRAQTLIELITKSPERADLILPHCESIMTDLELPNPSAATRAIGEAREAALDMLGSEANG